MFCHRCGAENPDDSVFCSRCGTGLIQSPARQNYPTRPAGQPAVYYGAPKREDSGSANRNASLLLLVFELVFSAIFAGLLTLIIVQYIIHGNLAAPIIAGVFVAGIILFFAVIHFGKLIRK